MESDPMEAQATVSMTTVSISSDPFSPHKFLHQRYIGVLKNLYQKNIIQRFTRFLFLNLNPMQGIGSSLYSELGHAQYNFEERLVFAG